MWIRWIHANIFRSHLMISILTRTEGSNKGVIVPLCSSVKLTSEQTHSRKRPLAIKRIKIFWTSQQIAQFNTNDEVALAPSLSLSSHEHNKVLEYPHVFKYPLNISISVTKYLHRHRAFYSFSLLSFGTAASTFQVLTMAGTAILNQGLLSAASFPY